MPNIGTFNLPRSTAAQADVRRPNDAAGEGSVDTVGRFEDLMSQSLRSNRSSGRGRMFGRLGSVQAIEVKDDPSRESVDGVRSQDESQHDAEDRTTSNPRTEAKDRTASASEQEKAPGRPKEAADRHDAQEDDTASDGSNAMAPEQTDLTPPPPPAAAAFLSQLQRLGGDVQTATATGGQTGEATSEAPMLIQAELAAMEGGTAGGKNAGASLSSASPGSASTLPNSGLPAAGADSSGSFLVSAEILRIWTGPGQVNADGASGEGDGGAAQGQLSLASSASHRIARFFCEPREQEVTSSQTAIAGGREQSGTGQTAVPQGGENSAQASMTPASIVSPAAGKDASGSSTTSGANTDLSASGQSSGETAANQNVDRIVQVLRAHVGRHDSQIRLRLDPPHLGQIQIDVTMQDDKLFLDVRTETAMGKELLGSRLQDLRDALSKHGIIMERATVQMRQEVADPAPSREQQQSSSHQNSNFNQDAPGHTPDQPQHRYRGGEALPGDEGSVPAWSAESVEPAGETRSEAGVAMTAAETLVDTVA